jgi:uncharacterized Tic20 family protein
VGYVLHLSFFAGYAVPVFGLVAPIIIWQVKKDELPGIDCHGKNMVNWLFSLVIYTLVCVLLLFIVLATGLKPSSLDESFRTLYWRYGKLSNRLSQSL